MVSFMCQIDWDTMPGYVVKHYSGCFCEGRFWMRFIFEVVDFE